jgi:hypothetical protein
MQFTNLSQLLIVALMATLQVAQAAPVSLIKHLIWFKTDYCHRPTQMLPWQHVIIRVQGVLVRHHQLEQPRVVLVA